ncbi:MAG: YciC family protein [Buchnera aphidicola (Floraphis choui)]
MHITTNSLYCDTISFFKKKWLIILIITFFSSSITSILDNIFALHLNILTIFYEFKTNHYHSLFDFIQTLTPDQQRQLLLFSIIKLCSSLIGNTFLISILTIFIQFTSLKKENFFLELKRTNPYLFMSVFLLILINTIVIQLGLVLLIVPGIIFFILLSLSPIILIINNTTITKSIIDSIQITLNNFKVVSPAIIIWIFLKLIILMLLSDINIISESISFFLLSIIINLISSILIIYLFRFHMLSRSFRYFK